MTNVAWPGAFLWRVFSSRRDPFALDQLAPKGPHGSLEELLPFRSASSFRRDKRREGHDGEAHLC